MHEKNLVEHRYVCRNEKFQTLYRIGYGRQHCGWKHNFWVTVDSVECHRRGIA